MKKSKRETLKKLVSLSYGIPLLAGLPTLTRGQEPKVSIRVGVHMPDAVLVPAGAKVEITQIGAAPQPTYAAERLGSLYHISAPPGTYTLTATGPGKLVAQRTVEVQKDGGYFDAYLGEEGWPSYRLGNADIPYLESDKYIAVVIELEGPWIALADALNQELQPFSAPGDYLPGTLKPSSRPFLTLNDQVFFLHLRDSARRAEAHARILDFFRTLRPDAIQEHRVRIGMPVIAVDGRFRMIDGRYFVRFPSGTTRSIAYELVEGAGAIVIRDRFLQAPNLYLIEFPGDDLQSQDNLLRAWHGSDPARIESYEADVIAQMRLHRFPGDPPNDALYSGQKQHFGSHQGIAEATGAWNWLANKGLPSLGAATVCIATLDSGIDPKHEDIDVNTMAACFDFSVFTPNRRCTDTRYSAWDAHGMAVFGLIGGKTNNALCSTGIAPGACQINISIPSDLWNAQYYGDILLWAAGFPSPTGWPAATPPSPGAGIINCSHGADYLPLSSTMDATFNYLVTNGRGSKGALIVYSAGNAGLPVSTISSWASHPKTVAVACSELVGPDEKIWTNSNYGPEIDLCALGQNIVSLAPTSDSSYPKCPGSNRSRYTQTFGATSSAAPMVSAVAALILTAKKDLLWSQLRDTLCLTAEKIDCTNNTSARGWRAIRTDPTATGITGCPANGVASPGASWSSWGYGFGRLNALNAVKLVAP